MTRVLVAEDEGVIGIALEDALAEAGYAIAGPFSSCSRAEDWLKNATPDLALLDVWLQDGPCFDLARVLRGRAVPVVFLSGGTAAARRPSPAGQTLQAMLQAPMFCKIETSCSGPGPRRRPRGGFADPAGPV